MNARKSPSTSLTSLPPGNSNNSNKQGLLNQENNNNNNNQRLSDKNLSQHIDDADDINPGGKLLENDDAENLGELDIDEEDD
jgi:hypothetical protein